MFFRKKICIYSIFIFLFGMLVMSCSADMSSASAGQKAKESSSTLEMDVSKEDKAIREAIEKELASGGDSGFKDQEGKFGIPKIVKQEGATVVVNSKEDFENIEGLSDEEKSKSIDLIKKQGISLESINEKDGIKINKALTGRMIRGNQKATKWVWNFSWWGTRYQYSAVKYVINYDQWDYTSLGGWGWYNWWRRYWVRKKIVRLNKHTVFKRHMTFFVLKRNGSLLWAWRGTDYGFKPHMETTFLNNSRNRFTIDNSDLYANDPSLYYGLPPEKRNIRRSLSDHSGIKSARSAITKIVAHYTSSGKKYYLDSQGRKVDAQGRRIGVKSVAVDLFENNPHNAHGDGRKTIVNTVSWLAKSDIKHFYRVEPADINSGQIKVYNIDRPTDGKVEVLGKYEALPGGVVDHGNLKWEISYLTGKTTTHAKQSGKWSQYSYLGLVNRANLNLPDRKYGMVKVNFIGDDNAQQSFILRWGGNISDYTAKYEETYWGPSDTGLYNRVYTNTGDVSYGEGGKAFLIKKTWTLGYSSFKNYTNTAYIQFDLDDTDDMNFAVSATSDDSSPSDYSEACFTIDIESMSNPGSYYGWSDYHLHEYIYKMKYDVYLNSHYVGYIIVNAKDTTTPIRFVINRDGAEASFSSGKAFKCEPNSHGYLRTKNTIKLIQDLNYREQLYNANTQPEKFKLHHKYTCFTSLEISDLRVR